MDDVAVDVPELLPGGVLSGTTELDSLPPYGKLSARMTVSAEDAGAEVSRTVWSVPWLPMLLLALAASAWWARRRHLGGRWFFSSRAQSAVVPDSEPEPIAVR
ncbi:hypothetical protein [Nocardioides piscis]|uniref:Uncharacterized protein n=1 Tax=Nocardioides piscis TaxID=2714938 RepID=A0A6G7YER9_9ACTN|nr:hypothetical protein [Nocardioides piscis]QIK75107.1 hypothetical protein G7071_06355 [Nocardioides piscis]